MFFQPELMVPFSALMSIFVRQISRLSLHALAGTLQGLLTKEVQFLLAAWLRCSFGPGIK